MCSRVRQAAPSDEGYQTHLQHKMTRLKASYPTTQVLRPRKRLSSSTAASPWARRAASGSRLQAERYGCMLSLTKPWSLNRSSDFSKHQETLTILRNMQEMLPAIVAGQNKADQVLGFQENVSKYLLDLHAHFQHEKASRQQEFQSGT